MATPSLTVERLRQLLHYDCGTGVFTWRVERYGICMGTVAGSTSKSDGYVQIGIDGVLYRAHRLAWLYMHGEWPRHGLDHRDTIRDHNWIDNLRLANQQENLQNLRGARSDSKSGVLGVCWNHSAGKWMAQLVRNGKNMHRSYHRKLEDAIAARRAAEIKYFPFRHFV